MNLEMKYSNNVIYWKKREKLNIYGSIQTIRHLKKTHFYLFKKSNEYPPIIKSNIVRSRFSLGKNKDRIYFQSIKARHGSIDSVVYIFEKTAYVSDCKDLSIIKMKKLKNLKCLIIDCLKFKTHPSHFNLEESLYIHRHLKPKKTILTNLHYDLDYNNLLKQLPSDVIPAYDGLKINL